nr:MAG TPA: hypothetical protein [Caudoviricetes sp.]
MRVGDPSQILGLNSYLGEIFRKNSGETTEQRQTLGCFPGEKRARAKEKHAVHFACGKAPPTGLEPATSGLVCIPGFADSDSGSELMIAA